MYMASFETPVFTTIGDFKREHQDLIGRVFFEKVNYGHNRYLIDFNRINVDSSKTRVYTNKYNSLTSEDIAKLLHIVEQGFITDEEEKILDNCNKKTLMMMA
ncbi:hypothetical protein [Methanosphaera sp. BMS]|uniref:hypothetical protein n=1 Tax=Methanosphaera sp. BMS TaxID=1789762 RepID=UPI000DC1ECFE|nr:hypothetical protein [Methanosphaera sp. BMS]AWX33426.1 hypothetical protein AW729_10115 [Methanosphaera sp. BMS]